MTIFSKKFIFTILMVILMCAFVETGLRVSHFLIRLFESENEKTTFETEEKRHLWPHYKDKIWAKNLFQETWQAALKTHPEDPIIFGSEYNGKYVHVDSQGYRGTWNPKKFKKKPKTIYMYGGSTIWGAFARDDHTIPSLISKKLYDKGYDFIVHNHGQSAFSFFPEILHLIFLLREGERPNYVIFYDGANDVKDAYGRADPKVKNDLTSQVEQEGNRHFFEKSEIYEGFRNIVSLFSVKEEEKNLPEYNDQELSFMARSLGNKYIKSLHFLDYLSKTFHVGYICFLQPTLYLKDNLTAEEIMGRESSGFHTESFTNVYQGIRSTLKLRNHPNFFDISDLFKDKNEHYFLDWVHMTEEGNEIVATKIVDLFKKRYLSNE